MAHFLLVTHPLICDYLAAVDFDNYSLNTNQFIQRHLQVLIQIEQAMTLAVADQPLEVPIVNLYYQAYHGLLRGWLASDDVLHLPTIKHELIDALLAANAWQASDLEANNNHVTMSVPRDAEGFLMAQARWHRDPTANRRYFQSIEGFSIDRNTGEIKFYFLPPKPDAYEASALFTLADFYEVIQLQLDGAFLSLDQADLHMPMHPFNTIRFEPPQLFRSQAFASMLLTDQMLKFMTTGKEPSAIYPFEQRDGTEFMKHLDLIQQWVIDEFRQLQAQQRLTEEVAIHRFWIETQQPIDIVRHEDNDNIRVTLDLFEMQVRMQPMRVNAQGVLVDNEHADEGWKIFFADKQRQTPITGPAIIIDKETSQVYFLDKEQEQIYPRTATNDRLLISVNLHKADDQRIYLAPLYGVARSAKFTSEGALIIDDMTAKYAFLFTYEVTTRAKLPNYYSAEYIFARRMTLHYEGFAYLIPQFGRLHQFQAMMTIYRLLNVEYLNNKLQLEHLEKTIPQVNAYLRQRLHHLSTDSARGSYPAEFAGITISAEIAERIEPMLQTILTEMGQGIGAITEEFLQLVNQHHKNLTTNMSQISDMRSYVSGNRHYVYSELQRSEDKRKASGIFEQGIRDLVNQYQLPAAEHAVVIKKCSTGRDKDLAGAAHIIARHVRCKRVEFNINEMISINSKQLDAPRRVNQRFERLGFGRTRTTQAKSRACTWTPAAINMQPGKQRIIYGGVKLFAEVRPSAAPAAQQSAVTADMTTFTNAVSADALYNMASRVSSSGYTEAGNFRSSTAAGGGASSGGGRGGSGGGDGSDSSGDEGGSRRSPRSIHRAHNMANYDRLRTELALKQGNILDANGRLTEYAKDNATKIIDGNRLGNFELKQQLVRDGSSINDWGKYSTPAAILPNGRNVHVHFYKNDRTGQVLYEHRDYKVKDFVDFNEARYGRDHNATVRQQVPTHNRSDAPQNKR